jgi:hypothetical protein
LVRDHEADIIVVANFLGRMGMGHVLTDWVVRIGKDMDALGTTLMNLAITGLY